MKYIPTELILVLNAEKFSCRSTLCARYTGNTDCQLEKHIDNFVSEIYESSIEVLNNSIEE